MSMSATHTRLEAIGAAVRAYATRCILAGCDEARYSWALDRLELAECAYCTGDDAELASAMSILENDLPEWLKGEKR